MGARPIPAGGVSGGGSGGGGAPTGAAGGSLAGTYPNPTIAANAITAAEIATGAVDVSTTDVTGTLAAGRFPALTGDVTTSAGALATTIAANAVSLSKLATQATLTTLANVTGGTAVPTAASVTQMRTMLLPSRTVVITESADAFTPVDVTITDIFRCALTTGTNTINQITAGTMYEGQEFWFRMEQDGTGGRTVVWDTTGTDSFKFTTTNPVPTLSTGVSAVDMVKFKYDATSQRAVCVGYNLGVA